MDPAGPLMTGVDDRASTSAADRRFNRSLSRSAAIAAVVLFVPLLIPLCLGRIFAHTDLAVFHLPLRRFYSMALAAGQSFVWSPNLFDGFYVHGEGQIGAFHPLHLFLYRLFPLTVAFNLEVILSYPFAFAGMWLLLRAMGLGAAARTVGAMLYAFSGFSILHIGHPNAIAIASHIPWLLLAVNATLYGSPRDRALGTCGVSLLIGSQVLLGYPQYVWISALACVVFALIHPGGPAPGRRLVWPAAAALAGVMIGGIQLLPTADLLAHSERASLGAGFQQTFSLHPLNLLQLWCPYVLPGRVFAVPGEYFVHEFGVYNGAFCTIAIVWALLRRGRLPSARAAGFAGALCAVGVVLALGRYGVLYDYISALPVVGKFRAPARHLLLAHFGLAVLGAIAFDDLRGFASRRTSPPRGLRWLALPLALGLATACVALILPGLLGSSSRPAVGALLTGVGLVAMATLLVRDAARGNTAALTVLPLLIAVDLGAWGYSYAWGSGPRAIGDIVGEASVPPGATAGMTVHDETGDPAVNYVLLRDLRVLRPYVGLFPRHALPATTTAALRLGGVDWVRQTSGWKKIDATMPRARIVPVARISQDPAADLASIDIDRIALVDRPVSASLAAPESVTVRLLVDQPGRLEFDVASPGPALLSITESFYSGWSVTANGLPTPGLTTLPLYGDYLGVVLVPGRYRLALVFRPASLRNGALVSLAGSLAMAMLAILHYVLYSRSRRFYSAA